MAKLEKSFNCMRSNDGLLVLRRKMPVPPVPDVDCPPKFVPVKISAPVLLLIAPPVQVAAEVQLPPLPVTVRLPLVPVLSRTMPAFALLALAEMLRKVNPLAPMVELTTLSAEPVVEVIVLMIEVLFWVALTVAPLPVALKPTPGVVVRLNPPVKFTVPPVFVRSIAFAVVVLAVMAPPKVVVP